jgi:hypothetical protein
VRLALAFLLVCVAAPAAAQTCDAPQVDLVDTIYIDHGRLLEPMTNHLSETDRTALVQDLELLGCVREVSGNDRIRATVYYFPDILMYGIVIEVYVGDQSTPVGRFEVYDSGFRLPRGPTIRQASSDAVLHSSPYGANHTPIP